MNIDAGLSIPENLDIDAVIHCAEQEGRKLYILPNTGIVDRESFFDAIREVLPLDPPLIGHRSWDALSDSLWEGLNSLEAARIVVIWPNSAVMRQLAAADFEIALQVLMDVANSLADPKKTNAEAKEVSILVG